MRPNISYGMMPASAVPSFYYSSVNLSSTERMHGLAFGVQGLGV